MMGYSLPTADIPITKSTNCVVALTAEDVRDDTTEWPCIRCGECAAACPARLLPQELLRAATGRRFERLTALGLVDCIECGCCDVVCPSHILLTARFRAAKIELAEHRAHARLADAADERYLRRKDRQLREADAARHEQDELKARLAGDEASRRAALSAAVERARGRKRSPDEPE
jgi:electron transport complex protein RnfC